MRTVTNFIYHYTNEQYLKSILTKGELIVSEWEKNNGVKPPALWLSLNDIWENTATKMVKVNGTIRELTKDEQFKMFGLIRFVIEFKPEKLCNWKKYKYQSNTTKQIYEAMEIKGKKLGAVPSEWFASFNNIPLTDCIYCQKWDGFNWITIIDFNNKTTNDKSN